jgi:hypothetical protein
MVCAGYLHLENLPPNPETEEAREGTAAGEYLQRVLMQQPLGDQATNGVYFDSDMKFYLHPIAAEIFSNVQGDIRCEQRIDWKTRSGITIRGSYDISFVRDGKLYIDDLKYGWGIVEVFENWQLLGYAIGEVIRRGIAFEKIILRIHQPRPHHELGSTRTWELTYPELLAYKEKIEARMDQLAAGRRDFQTGKNCKYCEGTADACPAFNRLFYRALEVSMEFVQDQMTEQQLGKQLEHADRALEVIKIKIDSLQELAVSRIKSGKVVPGYITENNYGHRKWKPGISPHVIQTLTGHKVTEEVMLSPAKAEKAGVPKDFVKALTEQYFIGQKLVRKDAGKVADAIFGKGKPT